MEVTHTETEAMCGLEKGTTWLKATVKRRQHRDPFKAKSPNKKMWHKWINKQHEGILKKNSTTS